MDHRRQQLIAHRWRSTNAEVGPGWTVNFSEVFPKGIHPIHFLGMFTIEHEFEATIITLVDDVGPHREDDVRIALEEGRTIIEQVDEETDAVNRITLSAGQLRDLAASIELPEGAYSKEP